MSMKRTGRIAKALSDLTEFPVESLSSLPILSVKGRGEAEITGCSGILEYDETRVVIKGGGMIYTVNGRGLLLSGFHNDTLTVRGEIDGVLFTAGEVRDV